MSPCPRSLRSPGPLLGAPRSLLPHLVLAAALLGVACGGGELGSRLEEARALQQSGEYEASIEAARRVLAERPDHPEANYLLGLALAQSGRHSQAVWPLQKAAESEEYAVDAGLLLASTLSANGDYGEAIRAASRVLEVDPGRTMALYTRAKAHLAERDPGQAVADTERLLEEKPGDYQALTLKFGALIDLERYDEAEATLAELREAAGETGQRDLQARACIVRARFHDSYRSQASADAVYEECLRSYPAHSLVLSTATTYYLDTERPDRAVEARQKAVEERPDRLQLRTGLGELLAGQQRTEEAESVYREAAELFDTSQAWKELADFYRELERYGDAREAVETALERVPQESPALRFELADLLVAEGRLERAEEMARGLERAAYRDLVLGRVRLAEDRPEEAVELFESGLAEWPNNAPARYYAGRAAERAGDYERAVSHYREARRVDAAATDAVGALARVRFLQGEYEAAVRLASEHVRQRSTGVREAYAVGIRALTALGRYDRARELATRVREEAGYELAGWIELAGVERRAEGPAAAARTLAESGLDLTDPENADALRALVEDRLRAGESEAALAAVERALEAHPETAIFHALRGWTLLRGAGAEEGARKAFEQALEREPESGWALAGLGEIAAREGEPERALDLFDRAAAQDGTGTESDYRAAQIALRLGRSEEAGERLGRVLRREPGHARAANDLAWLLAEEKRELDRALRLAKRAVDLRESATTLDTLGWVQLQRGEAPQAAATLERALERAPSSGSIRYRLGQALARAGEPERAQTMLERALEDGSFPEAAEARAALARLEER